MLRVAIAILLIPPIITGWFRFFTTEPPAHILARLDPNLVRFMVAEVVVFVLLLALVWLRLAIRKVPT